MQFMREDNILQDISKTELRTVDISLLTPFPDNRDISDTEIDVLAKQIYSSGFVSAITIAKEYEDTLSEGRPHKPTGRYIILDGHRRVEAIKLIQQTIDKNYMDGMVPCQVFITDLSYKSMYVINILGNQQKAETPKEIRERTLILAQLVKEGVITNISKSIPKIGNMSKRTYYAYSFINDNLCDSLKDIFDNGQLSMNACLKIAKHDEVFQNMIVEYCKERSGLVVQAQDIERLEHQYLEDENKALYKKAEVLENAVTELESQESLRKQNNSKAVQKSRDKSRKELDDKILELIYDLMRSGKVHSIYEAINTVDPQGVKEMEFSLQRLENDVKRLERRLKNNGTATELEIRRLDVAIRKLQDIGHELMGRAERIEKYLKRKKLNVN